MATFLSLGFLVVPNKAFAATTERSWDNSDTVKKVIANVSPVISNSTATMNSLSASLAFNSDEFFQKPLITETQVTKEEPKPIIRKKTYQTAAKPIAIINTSETYSVHSFPYGYCTYYVSQRRNVTWSGNAVTWLSNARAQGVLTGDTPQAGAIMVTSEGGYTGHVAYIESVDGDNINITEMNYHGWGVVSQRTISINDHSIMGYIY
jgi:surface antigen